MGTFVALEVAIGLVFMYLLLAIICTAINEWIATIFRLRARTLKTAVSRLVDAPPSENSSSRVEAGERLSSTLFAHPLIESVKDGKRGPSYIPAPRFAAALKSILAVQPQSGDERSLREGPLDRDVANVTAQLACLELTPPPRIRKAAVQGVAPPIAATDTQDEGDRIEEWFNDAMERATGWYRRRIMFITIAVATVITVLSNADTFAAARILWHNPTVRAAVVAQAQERAKRVAPTPSASDLVAVEASYADPDRPVASEGGMEDDAEPQPQNPQPSTPGSSDSTDEENPEVAARTAAAEEEEEGAGETDTGGITEAEREALGQFIGWSRDYRAINAKECIRRQRAVNAACSGGPEASETCKKAVDESTDGGVCEQTPKGLQATDAFPGFGGFTGLLFTHLFGWFITASAVSMGAPFWFDTLKRFVNVRGTGPSSGDKK